MSDDERREVAERLRSLVTDDSMYATVDVSCVLHAVGLYYEDIDRIYFHAHDVAMLADLIEPGEPKARCVAEVKVDGERLEQLAHDAAVELTGINRDALLALADEIEDNDVTYLVSTQYVLDSYARRIREALGVDDA